MNTVRSVSVSVHDIYSSAFYLALRFLCLRVISFLSSRHRSVSLAERKKEKEREKKNLMALYKQGVLGRAATAGKNASRRL